MSTRFQKYVLNKLCNQGCKINENAYVFNKNKKSHQAQVKIFAFGTYEIVIITGNIYFY